MHYQTVSKSEIMIKCHNSKDYKLRGLDTRQRRPQKWHYKPNYSILTQVFLDLPQLLQSSTDRAEYRQIKHINQSKEILS